ncbi:hypothetical protein BDA96_06G226600 [Sorghum bicolor]|uniref:Uncharacterized protein n=2 Tax=Sorghum bicolor TaxID=4558 RepID=A0A921QV79_SORBI|nr:uncharacterized protein LOC8072304 isoform X1 [Sorghum bicolor]EES12815.1 hypothetical protein SORBI_3006G207500 [Sorghum bicolor]KAG0527355.1 hypothetical protein BDA96_06G226600 [Sorghum bicolor]|eukprot:XP_002448487.1 uncharacterized protein LOC8072304 isoform X1 [Sorghum bicolor]
MARLLAARALTLARPSAAPSALRFCLCRSRALSDKVDFVEIDLSEESPSSSSGGGDAGDSATGQAKMGSRRLEDAIHGVLVRRAAPEWLPFVPGASYWVPPLPRPLGVANLLGAALYTSRGEAAMTEEEALSFTTVRGWPSAAYFVGGKFPPPVKKSWKDATKTDDDES